MSAIKRKRTFKQARARRTYEAILSAAAKIFPRRGFDGTQVPEIAQTAGVSIGAVYRYFVDKREIFLEMLQTHLQRGRDEVAARLALPQLDITRPSAAIRTVIDIVFEQVKKDAALGRVYLSMSLTDPDVGAMKRQAEAEDRAFVANVISALVPKRNVEEPEAAALVLQSAVLGAAVECHISRTITTPEAKVKDALTTLVHRYLFGAVPKA